MFNEKDQLAVNTLRALSVDQVEAANSGHPGLPMGAAPMAYALFADHLRIDPQETKWINRDRFLLSAGHGSALLYSLLHMSGYDVSMEDLKDFRQIESATPGHPEYNHTDGVEATTGPLGQGLAQAVGMALAERHTAGLFNTDKHKIIDHYTYAIVSDGDLMEGISYEACSLAGRQKLDKLIFLYDSNDISLDGELDQAFAEDIRQRFESQGWHYQLVEDGKDLTDISRAIKAAKEEDSKPSIIEVKTVIGYGSPNEGTSKVHGAPLGEDAWQITKEYYGYDYAPFEVPEEAKAVFQEKVQERGAEEREKWNQQFAAYQAEEPELAASLKQAFAHQLPENYDSGLELVSADEKADATRNSSGKAINALAQTIPYFWGGSADLSGSNKTVITDSGDFMPDNPAAKNIWFGVREFAMAAMLNGATLHGGNIIFGGTFFVFTDYLKAAVRLSALSRIPAIYVMTHDSVAVGEDGPTHEPIEQLAGFRAMSNLNLIRPADVNETYVAWKIAVESEEAPTMLVLTRQNVPVLANSQTLAEEGVRKGAYIISPAEKEQADGILIATGSEVAVAIEAQEILAAKGVDVSVVSMPSHNMFEAQSDEYKESVLPNAVRNRVSIEMASSFGWDKYVGLDGIKIAIDRYGVSGPGDAVIEYFGFTGDKVAQAYLDKFKS